MMMLERVEMQPGMAPAAFPSPIFAGSASVLVFLPLRSASSEITIGALFIGNLGQDTQLEIKTDNCGCSKPEIALVARPIPPMLKWATAPPLVVQVLQLLSFTRKCFRKNRWSF